MNYKPPFTLSEKTLNLVAEIMEIVTKLTMIEVEGINPKLRRNNRIKTIQASLAIENNSLSLDQVTAILNGKRILGPGQDIKEVQNAYGAYELLLDFNPYDVSSLLEVHKILMNDLTKEAGNFRSSGVCIFAREDLIHMAPHASFVPEQISQLLLWAKNSEVHPLIKSCVFHYEFEFMLESIHDSLVEISSTEQVGVQVSEQVEILLSAIGKDIVSGKELMERVGLKHRPTFRKNYLLPAIENGYLEMTIPDKPNSSKQKYRKSKT